MLTDYGSLQITLAQWVPRPDLTANIPTAIALAEAQINRSIRNRQQEQRATATLAEFTALQTDYIEVRDVWLDLATGHKKLELMSPSQLNDLDAARGGSTGEPQGYAIIANQYKVAPSPDQSYTVEMIYVKKVPALTGSATTNWFLTDHPDVYLIGAQAYLLRAGYEPNAQACMSDFQRLLADVNIADRRQRWSGPPMRVRPG